MKKVSVITNQTLLDISIQECGALLSVFDLAYLNDLSITDVIYPGMTLIIPESDFNKKDIQEYYQSRQLRIATSIGSEISEYFLIQTLPIIL